MGSGGWLQGCAAEAGPAAVVREEVRAEVGGGAGGEGGAGAAVCNGGDLAATAAPRLGARSGMRACLHGQECVSGR